MKTLKKVKARKANIRKSNISKKKEWKDLPVVQDFINELDEKEIKRKQICYDIVTSQREYVAKLTTVINVMFYNKRTIIDRFQV